MHPLSERRRAGVLLHPTSLPGPSLTGSLGAAARQTADLIAAAGFRVWQTLPLGPVDGTGSPYSARSVLAGDERLIDLADLRGEGWLAQTADLDWTTPADKRALHALAWQQFRSSAGTTEREELAGFRRERPWLEDYALYRALHDHHLGLPWWQWPDQQRHRVPAALEAARGKLAAEIELTVFEQFLFHRQWHALREYARQRDILLFGDMPLFPARDSADVWSCPDQFKLDAALNPIVVAGVPPDYFSATGQLWGNPVYAWEHQAKEGFRWWIQRLRVELERFDLLRIDHFRGLAAVWEVPGGAPTAESGQWVEAPGDRLLYRTCHDLGSLPLVAEDLGVITPDVVELRLRHELPGMKVLQFAFFGGSDNPYLPHNHEPASVCYTGTHDNHTTKGWAAHLDSHARSRACRYLRCTEAELPDALVWSCLSSVSRLAVLPAQDLIGLDDAHRMNVPGHIDPANWRWRMPNLEPLARGLERWREAVHLAGR